MPHSMPNIYFMLWHMFVILCFGVCTSQTTEFHFLCRIHGEQVQNNSVESLSFDHVKIRVFHNFTNLRRQMFYYNGRRHIHCKSTSLNACLCCEVLKCLCRRPAGECLNFKLSKRSCVEDLRNDNSSCHFLVFIYLQPPVNVVNDSQQTVLKFERQRPYLVKSKAITFPCKTFPSRHPHIQNRNTMNVSGLIKCNIFPLDFRINFFKCKNFRSSRLQIASLLKKKSVRFKRSKPFNKGKNEKSNTELYSTNMPTTRDKHLQLGPIVMKDSAGSPGKSSATASGRPLFTKLNETAYKLLLDQEEMKRRLRQESEWAYLCIVFILLLILFSIYIMRGFHSRMAKKREIKHDDKQHYLSIKEVLYRRARYLPMFNRGSDFEQVFVHDCGTDP